MAMLRRTANGPALLRSGRVSVLGGLLFLTAFTAASGLLCAQGRPALDLDEQNARVLLVIDRLPYVDELRRTFGFPTTIADVNEYYYREKAKHLDEIETLIRKHVREHLLPGLDPISFRLVYRNDPDAPASLTAAGESPSTALLTISYVEDMQGRYDYVTENLFGGVFQRFAGPKGFRINCELSLRKGDREVWRGTVQASNSPVVPVEKGLHADALERLGQEFRRLRFPK